MKKIYFLLLAFCFFNGLRAQTITFGSQPFKDRLLSANSTNGYAKDINGNNIVVDTNFDKEITASEALKVYYLELGGTKSTIYNLVGIDFFTNLKSLKFYGQRVTADLRALKNLEILDCGGDLVTKDLNINGLNLKEIRASNSSSLMPYMLDDSPTGISQFTNLEVLFFANENLQSVNLSAFKSLKTLVITNTKLTTLNLNGLSKLEELNCSNNLLTNLDLTSCTSLLNVNARANKFASFMMADNLITENLYLDDNLLLENVSVKNLSKLKYVSIANCIVTDLDLSDLAFLNSANCDRNALSNLNLKGCTSLETLSCYTNQLKTVDFSTCTKLSYFNGRKNLFKTLDFSNPVFSYIDCSENADLESFCIKNGKLINESSLSFTDNPKLKYICADDNEISLIQSKITSYGYTNCNANSYCNFVPSSVYYVIQGNQKLDNNSNGCDVLDFPIPNLKFKITSSNSGFFITDSAGNYSLPVPSGAHRITPVFENSSYFSVSPATVNIVFPTVSSPYTQNFCITPNGSQPDLEISLLPIDRARPGFNSSYKVVYKNKGNIMLSGAVNIAFNDAILDFISANPVITTQITNNLTWNFTNLKPFESKEITFTIKVNPPTATPAVNNGDVLVYTANITSTATDETPKDNTFILNQTVVGSFDPNDKTCLEGSVITPALIGEYVHYLIRFENKGTYSAQNIVIKDMIDLSKFDITTLVPTSSSHSFVTKISDNNKVEFIFENINLPFDDASNDGYIAFKIKTKPTLVVGDSFTNEANIYFDYNFPVLTNKATSKFAIALGTEDFVFSDYFSVYPNPAYEVLNISAKKNIEIQSIGVYDILGQLVIALPNIKDTSKIDVSNLRTGNYFLKIESDKGSSSIKFIKN